MFGYSEQLILKIAEAVFFRIREVVMKVIIENAGNVIWYRDDSKKEGMASRGYIKDGIQKKIITALESALVQAKVELQLSQDVD